MEEEYDVSCFGFLLWAAYATGERQLVKDSRSGKGRLAGG